MLTGMSGVRASLRDLPVAIESVGGISMEIMGLEPTTWPTYGGLKRGEE